jgi:hypothetical protein
LSYDLLGASDQLVSSIGYGGVAQSGWRVRQPHGRSGGTLKLAGARVYGDARHHTDAEYHGGGDASDVYADRAGDDRQRRDFDERGFIMLENFSLRLSSSA